MQRQPSVVMPPPATVASDELATGFSGHGSGLGPGAGRLAADLVSGATPVVDPTPFRCARMVDGSHLGKPGMM